MGTTDLIFEAERTKRWGCRAVGERLGDYVGGRLTEADKSTVAQHLHGCAACREALNLERTLVNAAEACTLRTAPDMLAASVLDARRHQGSLDVFRRVFGYYRTSCLRFAFRAFVDPILWAEYWMFYTFSPLRNGLAVAVLDVQERVMKEMVRIGEQITTPIKLA